MALKHILVLILIVNSFIACQGGLLGAATGLLVCTSSCQAGYFVCLAGGVTGAGKEYTNLKKIIFLCFKIYLAYTTATLATPGVVAACIAGEAACIGVCTTLFTVVTGPI